MEEWIRKMPSRRFDELLSILTAHHSNGMMN